MKNKALLILSDNVYLTPYISFYIDVLNELKYDYKVIFWDKNQNENNKNKNYIRFTYNQKEKLYKIFGYIKYRKFIINEIRKNDYDLVIPLHPVMLAVLFDVLVFNKNIKFVIDIRDYSYEKYLIFRIIEHVLMSKSLINIISSKEYTNFLPKKECYVVHNLPKVVGKKIKTMKMPKNIPLQLSYIGLIRFLEQNKRIIDLFLNDERFHINFIGTNSYKLKEYCDLKNAKNVSLIDTFDGDIVGNFYNLSDGILNLYGNGCPLLDYALSNKLYYSAIYKRPIFVCPNTYMEKISAEYHLGIAVDVSNKHEKDRIFDYIMSLDENKFRNHCELFIDDVSKEIDHSKKELIKRLNDNN